MKKRDALMFLLGMAVTVALGWVILAETKPLWLNRCDAAAKLKDGKLIVVMGCDPTMPGYYGRVEHIGPNMIAGAFPLEDGDNEEIVFTFKDRKDALAAREKLLDVLGLKKNLEERGK